MRRQSGITPYQLRHAFARTVTESVPRDLPKLMGHEDEATTRFYYEVPDERPIRAAKTITLSSAASVQRSTA